MTNVPLGLFVQLFADKSSFHEVFLALFGSSVAEGQIAADCGSII